MNSQPPPHSLVVLYSYSYSPSVNWLILGTGVVPYSLDVEQVIHNSCLFNDHYCMELHASMGSVDSSEKHLLFYA